MDEISSPEIASLDIDKVDHIEKNTRKAMQVAEKAEGAGFRGLSRGGWWALEKFGFLATCDFTEGASWDVLLKATGERFALVELTDEELREWEESGLFLPGEAGLKQYQERTSGLRRLKRFISSSELVEKKRSCKEDSCKERSRRERSRKERSQKAILKNGHSNSRLAEEQEGGSGLRSEDLSSRPEEPNRDSTGTRFGLVRLVRAEKMIEILSS